MNKKFVLYIGEMEFPDRNAAAQRVISNAKMLKKIGYKPILVGLSRELKYEKNYSVVRNVQKLNDFTLFQYPYPKTNIEWADYIKNIEYIKKIISLYNSNNIYALIAYNFPAIAMKKLIKYCRNKSIHFISDITEWYPSSKRKFPSSIVKDFDTFYRMKVVNKKAKNIICISSFLENYYQSKNCFTVVIPSLVDNHDKKWEPSNPVFSDKRVFVYAGSPGKGMDKDRLDWIIEAFYHFKKKKIDFIFKVIGIDKKTYLKSMNKHSRIINELDNIIFHGRKSHRETIDHIKDADFSIFARVNNRVSNAGFPTKLAESFACGTPVITTPTSDIPDYLVDWENGFLAKENTYKGLKLAMSKAFDISNAELEKIKKNCRINNPLDYRKFTTKMERFMNNLN